MCKPHSFPVLLGVFWMREPISDAFWQDWSGFKDARFLHVFIKEMTFYVIWHFITFFKLKKKKVDAKLISMRVLNKMFLQCLHRDHPGDKGHLGATSPCERQLLGANGWVPWAHRRARPAAIASSWPRSQSRVVSLGIKPCQRGCHIRLWEFLL